MRLEPAPRALSGPLQARSIVTADANRRQTPSVTRVPTPLRPRVGKLVPRTFLGTEHPRAPAA